MRIPEVQEQLRAIAAEYADSRLEALADELSRRPARRRAPSTSNPMTRQLRLEIRRYAEANPTASQSDIARAFNVNPGRVSETLRGFRH